MAIFDVVLSFVAVLPVVSSGLQTGYLGSLAPKGRSTVLDMAVPYRLSGSPPIEIKVSEPSPTISQDNVDYCAVRTHGVFQLIATLWIDHATIDAV